MNRSHLRNAVFSVTEDRFDDLARNVFQYQYEHNEIYREYCRLIAREPSSIARLEEIPFLPISFFKTHRIVSGDGHPEKTFSSSGTTGLNTSHHDVSDLKLYEESFLRGFQNFFGHPSGFVILALLPSYLERTGSSLVYMTEGLMKESGRRENGFFLYDHDELADRIQQLESQNQKTILIGVSFALLDFAQKFPMPLKHTVLIETGGMKGRREEITREQLHATLMDSFELKSVCSEYGMTELLSQAYSLSNGKFHTPSWVKVMIRDINDPFAVNRVTSGALNIIDLANLDSCSFIATDDLGKRNDDGSFEILGRLDFSDVRGCNLMWEGKTISL